MIQSKATFIICSAIFCRLVLPSDNSRSSSARRSLTSSGSLDTSISMSAIMKGKSRNVNREIIVVVTFCTDRSRDSPSCSTLPHLSIARFAERVGFQTPGFLPARFSYYDCLNVNRQQNPTDKHKSFPFSVFPHK